MSILIEGMEMPKEDEEIIIRISPNGTVMTEYALPITGVKAVPVPPHGRLIDVDKLIEFIENRYEITWKDDYEGGIKDACVDILEKISTTPTVIPASGEE